MKTHHTWPLGIARQLLRHKPVDERRRDHERNEASGPLGRCGAEGNRCGVERKSVARGLGSVDEGCGKRCREQQRVCWKDPCRCHCVDRKDAVAVSERALG